MSYQMCPNFINSAFNNIPLNKCYFHHHLQSTESLFNFQDLSTYLYILLIFLLLLILYTNLRNKLIPSPSNLSSLKHSLLLNLIYYKHFIFSNLILSLSVHPLSFFKSILLSNPCFLNFLHHFLDFLYELTHFTIICTNIGLYSYGLFMHNYSINLCNFSCVYYNLLQIIT
jgi:hypothetical protein